MSPSARSEDLLTAPTSLPDVFLRSINVRQDCEFPERIAHFRPTAKSISVIRALAGMEPDRAFLVVAPYGSGKSLAATYLLHLIENRDESIEVLETINSRLSPADAKLAEEAEERREDGDQYGFVLTLSGHQRSVAGAIKEAALDSLARLKMGRQARTIKNMRADKPEDAIRILETLRDKAESFSADRIAIVWDEFGQHVQTLITEGRSADLLIVQDLAEFVSRQEAPRFTLGLLMHQTLLRYAGNLPQTVRSEWAKIEGRFRTIQYVDDSREIYQLIADLVDSPGVPRSVDLTKMARACQDYGILKDLPGNELESILERSYPLEPVTLYLLPRLAARVAQNERTLFSFLNEVDLSQPVTPEHLYDFFEPAMKADTAVGGTYRPWLETQSALAKTDGDRTSIRLLKTVCLLGLGVSGERAKASRKLLAFAGAGYGTKRGVAATVRKLIERKLLLHRTHSDDVSVWHGTDLDLRGKLEERAAARAQDFDLREFLMTEAPAPYWRPVEHNARAAVQRYFEGEYHTPESIRQLLEFEVHLKGLPPGTDGRILYLVVDSADEMKEIDGVADTLEHPQLLLAIPRTPLEMTDAAVEVACLEEMQHDKQLIDTDPLIVPELLQMTDDARKNLHRIIERLHLPSQHGPRWFHQGQELEVNQPADLRRHLSRIADQVFQLAPEIRNENIVRHKPTPILINARKKLVLGILERYGQELLGIEGNFPDASMFRTVLLHTGLYRSDSDGRWRFATPEELKDPALSAVWAEVRDFFSIPRKEPKQPAKLFDRLTSPPYGLRAGLLPILFAAGIKAFPSAMSIMRGDEYLPDLLPSDIEEICRDPERYGVRILPLDSEKEELLDTVLSVFERGEPGRPRGGEKVRRAYDALRRWAEKLPPAATSTRRVSPAARRLQRALNASDPVVTLFELLPAAISESGNGTEGILLDLKRQLESAGDKYYDEAESILRGALGCPERETALGQGTSQLFANLDPRLIESLGIGIERALINELSSADQDSRELLDRASNLLVGRPVGRWHDESRIEFERAIHGILGRLEDTLIEASTNNGRVDAAGARRFLDHRLARLQDMRARIDHSNEHSEEPVTVVPS